MSSSCAPPVQEPGRPEIWYRKLKGYKYELSVAYEHDTGICPTRWIGNRFVILGSAGKLSVFAGYAWDGPSGPTLDTPDFMRASLVHDALYQLMRTGLLDVSYRPVADQLLHDICREDGMSRLRAWYVLKAVRLFAASSARPSGEPVAPEVFSAP